MQKTTLDEVGYRHGEAAKGFRRRWAVRICLLLLTLSSGAAGGMPEGMMVAPEIAVSPSRFEILIGSKPVTRTLRVVNLGREPVEFKISVATWDLDEQNQVRNLESTEQTLDRWMRINPIRFTVVEGGMQVVRFSVLPKLQLDPGEHRAMIYLTESSGDGDRVRGVDLRFKMGIAVYAYVPDVVRQGFVHDVWVDVSVNPPVATIDVDSTGNSHVRLQGRYSVWPAEGFRRHQGSGFDRFDGEGERPVVESGGLPAIPVLPNSRRELAFPLKGGLEFGDYVLDIQGTIEGSRIDRLVAFTVSD